MNKNKVYPRAFSHIGLSVSDVEKAVEFYTNVFGWYVIMKPTLINEDDENISKMCDDVFGKERGKIKIAHLSTSDKIGVELFEFEDNFKPKKNLNFKQTGIFHFAIQDPDVEGLLEKIKANGGKQTTNINYYYPDENNFRMVYCEDPFGNVFELYSHSYELIYSKGSY